jgi:exopolysaccharide biosynthesis protein
MKIMDNMPIIIVITALLLNIAIGVSNNISFTTLMIRCIFVTIIFGAFGYIVTETIKNAIEISEISKKGHKKNADSSDMADSSDREENNSTLDIKVPPLDYEEFSNIEDDSNNEFVELNPAFMSGYKQDEQDNNI